MSVCIKCKVIVVENFFVCAGECRHLIHYVCAGLKKPAYEAISSIPNFSWRCDDCIDVFKNQNEKNEKLQKSIESISTIVNTLKETSSVINNKIDKIIKPTFHSSSTHTNSPKQPNYVPAQNTRSKQSKQIEKNSTTPITTTPTASHSVSNFSMRRVDEDVPNNVIIGSDTMNSSLRTVEPLKWLFISRLYKDVSAEDVKTFIQEKFGIIDGKFALVKMNPKLSIDESREYVSFKLGVPNNNFEDLLNPSSWPAGVLIKEFVYRGNKSNRRFLVSRSALIQRETE